MSQDKLADMLTKIRNAVRTKHERVDIPLSKLKLEVIKIFKNEGFIKNFKLVEEDGRSFIRVFLKYTEENKSVIQDLQRISRPSFRKYCGKDEIPRLFNGLGVTVVSTSHGVLTGKKAREAGVGGEILCQIW